MLIPFSVAILAAGRGTRMCSRHPKVLHTLAGKPLVQHVIDTTQQLAARQCYLVYGHEGEQLRARLGQQPLQWIHQEKQHGTGHAVQQVLSCALPKLSDQETLLVLYGDVPLITGDTLQRLLAAKPIGGISLLTAEIARPDGYGRVVRECDQCDVSDEEKKDTSNWGERGEVIGIVEHREANQQQRQIREINSGILVADVVDLKRWLSKISNNNVANEYYLTDIIALARAEGRSIQTCRPATISEITGVNDRWQLARLERCYQAAQAERLSYAGVTFTDPARFDLRGELVHGIDVIIESNVVLQGRVILGDGVTIGTGCLLSDCTIGDYCQIKPYTLIEGSLVAPGCVVGPFARLRPGSELQEAAKIGNFVEMKQARLGKGSKANHLSYLGDAEVGDGVNLGAGTITCNYNGANKLKTTVGNDVFIGAGSQLVAPVTIGAGATIGAGTTVTQSVAQDELVVGRAPQRHIQGWQRPGARIKKSQ